MTTRVQATLNLLRGLLAAFNAHDRRRIMTFFSDDCSLAMPRGAEPFGTRSAGKKQVRAGLASRFASVPDVHYADDEHWVCGDNAVSRWLLTGTTTDGRRLKVRGCDLLEFRDGACVRKESYSKIVDGCASASASS